MRCRGVVVCLVLGCGLLGRAWGQEAAPTTPSAAAKPAEAMTLQQALAQLSPAPEGVILTVGPQWEKLPQGTPAPKPTSTPTDVAQAFGKARRRFGAVVAVAPPTMVLLNPTPGEPNPYDGMPSYDVLPLFAASLSQGQWAALTGEQGLSIASLTQTQRQLFAQLLPDGQLKVEPWRDNFVPNPEGSERDLSGDLPAARLRLKQTAEVMLPIKGQENSYYPGISEVPPSSGPPVYKLVPNYGGVNALYGQQVRTEVPNAPKRGQLDLRLPALQTPIPVGGLKTVGDLMARVAQATHLELYADRRLEQKTLMILGTGGAAPAADLLQATAYCLTGLYRQVGPAFLLTDDVEGIATRMARWYQFEKYADALRQKPLQEARAALNERYGKQKLNAFGDPLAPTEDQEKTSSEGFPLAKLTSDQQQAVRAMADRWNKEVTDGHNGGQPVDTDGKIRLDPAVGLQLLVPSLQAPIDMDMRMPKSILFSPPPLTKEEQHAQGEKQIREMLATKWNEMFKSIHEHPEMWDSFRKEFPDLAAEILAAHPELAAIVNRPTPAVPKLLDALTLVPDRAALVAPRTIEDAAADVAAARALRLNQLWVAFFADGKPRPDVLAEALRRTKGTPLKVYAVLDLLSWGPKPPAAVEDLTVLGETSVQAAERHQQLLALQGDHAYDNDQDLETTPGVAVNPLAPDVGETLLAQIGSLKDMPGLAGVVFRQTAPPGYDLRANQESNSSQILGYQADMRLAFLRTHHADPVDVFSNGYNGKADTALPNFQYDSSISSKVADEWNAYRRDANLYLLRRLRAAARPLRVIVKQRGAPMGMIDVDGKTYHSPGWYAAWDAPKAPPPTRYGYRDDRATQPLAGLDDVAQARAQSAVVLNEIPADGPFGLATGNAMNMAAAWKQKPPPGFVIDAGARRLSQVVSGLKK